MDEPKLFEPRTECFAWERTIRTCTVLNRCECEYTENCPFFKTSEQFRADRLKAHKRLKKLNKLNK